MESIAISAASAGGFSCLYGCLKRGAATTTAAANACVSAVHAMLMIALSYRILMDGEDMAALKTAAALSISLGYFVYDFMCCVSMDLERGKWNHLNFVHHGLAILGTSSALMTSKGEREVLMSIFLAEMSTPFLHARTLLKEQGFTSKDLLRLVEILFAVSFTVFRILICPFLTYQTVLMADGCLLVKVCGVGLQLISFYWFGIIMKMARRKLASSQSPKSHAS